MIHHLLDSTNGTLPCLFRIKRYRDSGEWLYSTAGDLIVHRQKNTILQYSQCVDALVPFHALRRAPYRSCLPCYLPVGDSNIELSFFPQGGHEMGKILRSKDYQIRIIKIRTSDLGENKVGSGFVSFRFFFFFFGKRFYSR
jgi:hypothetical protein